MAFRLRQAKSTVIAVFPRTRSVVFPRVSMPINLSKYENRNPCTTLSPRIGGPGGRTHHHRTIPLPHDWGRGANPRAEQSLSPRIGGRGANPRAPYFFPPGFTSFCTSGVFKFSFVTT